MLQSIDDCIIAADDAGAVTFMNRQAEEVTGFAAADVVGKELGDVFRVDPWFEIASDARVIMTRRDGSTTIVEHSVGPIIDAAGDAHGTVVSFRDVSARLHRDEARALSERLSTVATIAAGVSHELNNPVAAIESNLIFASAELAALRSHSAKLEPVLRDASEALADGAAGLERVKDIVRQLKIFLFADAGPARVDLADSMHIALRLLARELDKVADVDVDVDVDGCAVVMCDQGQIVQCFMNVLKNASQAISPHTRGRISVRIRCESPYAVVDISDDGEGIGERDLGRIFEPFFTTRAPGAGVGLGLSIARAILLRAGGRIDATSTMGAGSTLRIELPLASWHR